MRTLILVLIALLWASRSIAAPVARPQVLPEKAASKSAAAAGAPTGPTAEAPVTEQEQVGPDKTAQQGGDTYNFYFQKAPGANEVRQGKEQTVKPGRDLEMEEELDEPQAAQEPIRQQAKVPAREVIKGDDGRVDLQLGLIFVPGLGGAGLSAGGQFDATKSLGLQVHLFALGYEPTDGGGTETFSARGSFESHKTGDALGGSVALAFAPLSFMAGSQKAKLQLLAGGMFLSDTVTERSENFSAFGSDNQEKKTKKSEAMGFAGVDATAYLSRDFGIGAFAKITSKPDYSQFGLNLVWHL